MFIANPIYDAVFKYLMEDKEVAMILISEILGETVLELNFLPQEAVAEVNRDHRSFTIYRMDFSATIQQPGDQAKQVIIEIQKAKLHTDIMRFRNYLGMQYSRKDNVYEKEIAGIMVKQALPIYSIYFLGHRLNHVTAPVVQVKREYWDRFSGEKITEREEFIESLTHDSIVIQIPQLKKEVRNDLERLLSVFNQSYVVTKDHHALDIDDELYPEKYRKVLRRLMRALSEEQMRRNMEIEDDFLADLQEQEREVLEAKEVAAKANERAEQAEQENQKLLELLKKHGIDP